MEKTNLPFTLDPKRGRITGAEEEIPGVYYVAVCQEGVRQFPDELYVVLPDLAGDAISREALSYGKKEGDLYIFEHDREGSGDLLISFEIAQYKVRNKIPLEYNDTLYCTALCGAELYPQYFGEVIPPRHTPYGYTVRYKTIVPGTFFLETDRAEWILALSYLACSELTDPVIELGTSYEQDGGEEDPDEVKYLFFDKEVYILVIYELLSMGGYDALGNYITSREVLETALWDAFPEYTAARVAEQIKYLKIRKKLFREIPVDCGEEPDKEEIRDIEKMKALAAQHQGCPQYNPALSGKPLLLLP